VIARIAHPASKLESFEFISDYFGINHGRRDFYRVLNELPKLKDEVENKIIAVAKKNFGFNFSLVFYDLTTLYFESFATDDLRKIGFSKDNKSANPQVMIGLLVNDLGFPISYQLFAGNKFEGHSLMPSILSLRKKRKIKQMTVVADSAMISDDNIKFLRSEKLHYIVAARTANLPIRTIEEISKELNQKDEATIRIKTESKGDLILHFSNKRYNKEKRELEKQLEKAKIILKTPSKAEIIKRTKFLKGKKLGYELNQELIHKASLLLGIKGYYTNCSNLSNAEIISHYKNLWHVEQAFRISKSDLKTRPIFHNKQQAIEAHILICFMALAISKYIEIKTTKSIKAAIKTLKKSVDARIYDPTTKQEFLIKAKTNEIIQEILELI
jgi:transposase